MPMTAHANILKLRLFLEGIEVPIIAIQTQSAPSSPTVATIQIPPLAEATRLLPRTTVHCFFLDLYEDPAALDDTYIGEHDDDPTLVERSQQRVKQAEEANDFNATINSYRDIANDRWKLLFGGEIVGFTWTKSAVNRSILLQCEDWSNYWDYAYQAANHSVFGPGLKTVFSGASTNLFTDLLFPGKNHIITNIVASGRCNTFPQLKGLAAGIVRLIEAVGGSYYSYPRRDRKKPPKRIGGQNIFFSFNELRLHLTQMVGTVEKDPTGQRLLKVQGYTGLFNRMLGGSGGQTSIREAITGLSKVMFYEMFPQPCPKYKPGRYGEVSGTRRAAMRDSPDYAKLVSTSDAVSTTLAYLSGAIAQIAQEKEASEIRKLSAHWIQQIQNARRILQRAKSRARGAPEPAPSKFSSAISKLGKVITTTGKLRSGKGAQSELIKEINDLMFEASEELSSIGDVSAPVGSYAERRPAQLYQHIFRPDVWFTAPPRCNVLFPEAYDNLSYQRIFLQEPTRFILKTNDEMLGPNMFTDKFYFAPKSTTIKGNALNVRSAMKGELLKHERFTGILPIFEKMGEFNVFARRVQGKQDPNSPIKIGLAQKTANFLYFRHRFNARRMQVRGKFNPYVAVGFPGLIIDKWVDRETIEQHNRLREEYEQEFRKAEGSVPRLDASAIMGTNFLGNFTQVVHQVSNPQQQGMTDIAVTFARQPEESVEYLSSIPDDDEVHTEVEESSARRSIDVAALNAPKLFAVGPNGGKIVNVIDVTKDFVDRELPLYTSEKRPTEDFKEKKVKVGITIHFNDEPTGEEGDDSFSPLGALRKVNRFLVEQGIFYRAFKITEEIPRYRRERKFLPAEEYIRPGWYGDIWTNQQIGTVYQEFFSTGSITDPQTVNDFGRTDTVLHDEGSLQSMSAGDNLDQDRAAIPSLREGSSIQDAVDFLHATYSYVKQANIDADEFISAYTWRPIATMLDLFGTSDLVYSQDGQEVIGGVEGFHSRAVAGGSDNPESGRNMFGLVNPEIKNILGIKKDSTAAQEVDTRAEKREMVAQYLTALLFSSALLG
jgi:hypothetical protein